MNINSDNNWRRIWKRAGFSTDTNWQIDHGKNSPTTEPRNDPIWRLIQLNQNDIFLDVGCGTGRNIALAKSHVKNTIGFDISYTCLCRAKTRENRSNIGKFGLFAGDICSIPIKEDKITKVLCVSVLQYLNNSECLLYFKELRRICKKNAIIVLHVKNRSSLYCYSILITKLIKRILGFKIHMENYRSWKWYKNELNKNGINTVSTYSRKIFLLNIFPKQLYYKILKIESKLYDLNYFRNAGSEFYLKLIVRKLR